MVRARIDWTGSQAVRVEVGEGRAVTLIVEPAGGLLTALFTSWKRDTWLELRELRGQQP